MNLGNLLTEPYETPELEKLAEVANDYVYDMAMRVGGYPGSYLLTDTHVIYTRGSREKGGSDIEVSTHAEFTEMIREEEEEFAEEDEEDTAE